MGRQRKRRSRRKVNICSRMVTLPPVTLTPSLSFKEQKIIKISVDNKIEAKKITFLYQGGPQ